MILLFELGGPREEGNPNKIRCYASLAHRVVVVLSVSFPETESEEKGYWRGDWAMYIDAVPGKNHRLEWPEVARTGRKLHPELGEFLGREEVINVGRMLERDFTELPYRR